jgi:cell division protein ZapA (FtsZ GTPase activity inhibitor)
MQVSVEPRHAKVFHQHLASDTSYSLESREEPTPVSIHKSKNTDARFRLRRTNTEIWKIVSFSGIGSGHHPGAHKGQGKPRCRASIMSTILTSHCLPQMSPTISEAFDRQQMTSINAEHILERRLQSLEESIDNLQRYVHTRSERKHLRLTEITTISTRSSVRLMKL